MLLPALSRDRVRRVDQIAVDQYEMPSIVLMENAGRGAAAIIDSIAKPDEPIAILCGKGSNAGDGYVIARYLDLAGRDVTIFSIVEAFELSGDAGINASIAQRSSLPIERVAPETIAEKLAGAGTIVDCLLGTGSHGPPRGVFADCVSAANATQATRVAIDVPTGLDCDSGEPAEPVFRADHTITFVAPKIGFEKNNANQFVGAVHVVQIGVPRKLLETLV